MIVIFPFLYIIRNAHQKLMIVQMATYHFNGRLMTIYFIIINVLDVVRLHVINISEKKYLNNSYIFYLMTND